MDNEVTKKPERELSIIIHDHNSNCNNDNKAYPSSRLSIQNDYLNMYYLHKRQTNVKVNAVLQGLLYQVFRKHFEY